MLQTHCWLSSRLPLWFVLRSRALRMCDPNKLSHSWEMVSAPVLVQWRPLKGPVTRGDLSPRQATSCDMYVFMQFDTTTCHMNSNKFEFIRQVTATKCHMHILSPKPIAGLPCDRRPWEKRLGTVAVTCRRNKSPRVTCMWFCHGDMLLGPVASCDRTLRVLM